MTRFCAKFFAYLLLGFIVLKHDLSQPSVEAFCLLLANIAGHSMAFFDSAIEIRHTIILRHTYGYAIDIAKSCSALTYVITLAAAILATPITMGLKLRALLLSFLAIQVVNLLRIISLLYAKVWLQPVQFTFVHEQLWLYLFACFIAFYFIHWFKQQSSQTLTFKAIQPQ